MTAALLERKRHDLELELTGLIHVRALLDLRGASAAEIEAHSLAIDRLRSRLALLGTDA
jgi:hypothetical protein